MQFIRFSIEFGSSLQWTLYDGTYTAIEMETEQAAAESSIHFFHTRRKKIGSWRISKQKLRMKEGGQIINQNNQVIKQNGH